MQAISISIQRENAASIMGTLGPQRNLDDYFDITQSGTLIKNTRQNYPTLSVTSLTGEEKQRFRDYKNDHLPNANVLGPMQMQLLGKFQQPCL